MDTGPGFIEEKQPVGTFVYQITFTDNDNNQRHQCLKTSGDAAFNVTEGCAVVTAMPIDGVLEPVHRSITFVIVDNGAPRLTSVPVVLPITVLLVNEPPVLVSSLIVDVDETLLAGAFVHQVLVTDREVGVLLPLDLHHPSAFQARFPASPSFLTTVGVSKLLHCPWPWVPCGFVGGPV